MNKTLTLGIDVGSRTLKGVILNSENLTVADSIVRETTALPKEAAQLMIDELLKRNKLAKKDIAFTVSSGYGREQISEADKTVTEITCQAAGIRHLFPEAKTIIDIGGQDSKAIKVENGIVCDFAMNDRCAAGTGRFLEIVENILELSKDQTYETAIKAKNPCSINNMCVVFAESEIISLLASGRNKCDIFAGVLNSLAKRTAALAGKIGVEPPVIFTGGVALSKAMTESLAKALGEKIITPANPSVTVALGAAIIAAKRLKRKNLQDKSF